LIAIGFVLCFASFVFRFLSIDSAARVLSDLAFRSPVVQWMSMDNNLPMDEHEKTETIYPLSLIPTK